MPSRSLPRLASHVHGIVFGLFLGVSALTVSASADGLKDDIAPTGKLRVGIGISRSGGAYWSNKN